MLLSSDTKNCPVKLYMSTLGSTQSIQSCKSRLNRVAKMHGSDFDSFDFTTLTYKDVVADVNQIIVDGSTHSTSNQTLSFLKGVMKQAWLMNLYPAEEYQKIYAIRKKKGFRLPTGQALSKQQVQKLFESCSKDQNRARGLRDAAILSLGFHLALRRSEIGKVQIEDIDFSSSKIKIIGKGNKQAEIPMSSICVSHLMNWMEERERQLTSANCVDSGCLLGKVHLSGNVTEFNGLRGEAIAKILKDIVDRSGAKFAKKLTPHDMRRTRITDWLTAGSARIAQKLARHADIQTTFLYDRSDAWPEMQALQEICD